MPPRGAAEPVAYGGLVISRPCAYFQADPQVDPPADGCASCLEIGGTWFHLRQCLACGRTGCCDQSEHRHATAHFRETGHPMIRTAQPGEDWQWCYLDDRLYMPGDATDDADDAAATADQQEGRIR